MDGIDNITNFLISPERNIAILFFNRKIYSKYRLFKIIFLFQAFF